MSTIIELEDFSKEAKRRQRKEKIKKGLINVANFCNRNKEILMIAIPAGVTVVGGFIKGINRHVKLNKEKNLKELYCYDRSLGHYWRLKRELSNSEWVQIDKRKAQGERLADILSELKVLK